MHTHLYNLVGDCKWLGQARQLEIEKRGTSVFYFYLPLPGAADDGRGKEHHFRIGANQRLQKTMNELFVEI